jgi:hypothetical protein
MKASTIIEAFADSAQARALRAAPGAGHRDIERSTISFITELYGNRAKPGSKASDQLKAGTDLIRTCGAWTRSLAEGESMELELDWNPDELMDYAAADLRRFVAEFERSPGHWICAPGQTGPHFSRLKNRGG